MTELTVKRRLVKSPPELWAELSEVERLAKHLDAFGEIRITRLEPERAVEWQAERAEGSVSIEASGWGTEVVVSASLADEEPAQEPQIAAEAEPPRRRPFSRVIDWLERPRTDRLHELAADRPAEAQAPHPEPEPEPAQEEEARPALGRQQAEAVLDQVLDNLGAAHHRPFSRA